MDFLQIDALSPHAAIIKEWVWKEWGEDNNRSFMEKLIESTLGGSLVPSTWSCFLDGKQAGTVSLFVIDLKCRQDLTPWVACLYVHPDYRKKGIGTALLKHAEVIAAKAGYDSVYLFTHLEGFYESACWRFEGLEMNSSGHEVRLYKKDLNC